MKKFALTFIPFIIIALGIVLYRFDVIDFWSGEHDGMDSYDRDIIVLNENYPTDIIIYGEDIPFRKELITRKINNISKEVLTTDKNYQVLVISDLSGILEISDEELLIVKDALLKFELDFYYLGTEKMARLKDLGFYEDDWSSDDYCFSSIKYEGRRAYFAGIWAKRDVEITNNNKETLGEILVDQFVSVIRSNN